MQAAKQAVSEFLHHGNKHSVDIEQETKPAILHETVAESQHENVVHAIDREVHQHHHQIHVQPIQQKVVEDEKHHHKVIPIEHRHKHHGKDQQIETALAAEHGRFKNEQKVLPVQTSSQQNVMVGEHVHHHVHDYIQPVIERERVVPHIVHTTVPIHEHIEHEPYLHKGNVLPTMTMEEFTKKGFSLKGSKKPLEHIDYEGNPLEIDGQSHVGFGKSATAAEMYDPMSGRQHEGISGRQQEGMIGRQQESMIGRQQEGMTGRQQEGMIGRQQEGMIGRQQEGISGRQPEIMTGRQQEGISREPDMNTSPTGNKYGQAPAEGTSAPVTGAAGAAAAGAAGAAGIAATKAYAHGSKPKSKRHGSLSSSEEDKDKRVPRSFSTKSGGKKNGTTPRKHGWLEKLNPRADPTSETV
ncbi:hypothetical protein AA313_de0205395 [Arthrobotrys entomopaga]|nr:hypothetical protein AA313_de0205395 [Arthrobotrys entomopaga]